MKVFKKISKHLPHYISLIGILFAAFLAFLFFSTDKFFLTGVAVAVSCAYLSWGVIHHLLHKDMSLAIFVEYLSVSVLGLIIVLSLIFRL